MFMQLELGLETLPSVLEHTDAVRFLTGRCEPMSWHLKERA